MTMNDEPDVIDGLGARLEQRAAAATPAAAAAARAALDGRIAALAARRRRGRAAGALVACVAVLGVGALAVGLAAGGDGEREERVDTGAVVPASPATPTASAASTAPPAGPFALDAAEFTLDHASDDEVLATEEAVPYVQTFRRGEDGASPILFVTVAPPNVRYGIGDPTLDPAASVVTVQGREGVLIDAGGRMPSLGWRLDDGTTISLRGWALGARQLHAVAERLRARDDAPGFDLEGDADEPEPALRLAIEGFAQQRAGRYTETRYATAGGASIDVRQFSGDALALQRRLLDRLDSADSLSFGTVRSAKAWIAAADGRVTILWEEGGMIGEIDVEGTDTSIARLAMTSVTTVDDDAAWQAMLDRSS